MKKILLQFAALLLVIGCIFVFTGHTDGWIEPPEDEVTGDIILSGTKYSGKVVIKVTLHPDGTGEHEGNGTVVPATWEKGEGDVAMVVHFNVKGTDYDMNVRDEGTQYVADYPIVADMQLTGGKPVKDIILSGEKYSGKVVVKVTLHADGTGEHEGNGDVVPATWEAGTGDVAMVVHFNVKGTDYDMNVRDDGTKYIADYPIVADMQLTGSKSGASAEPTAVEEPTEAPAATEAPADTDKPAAADVPAAEETGYAPNTFVLPFTADINEKLSTTFFVESSVWGPALGASGSYMPTESEDLLFSWSCAGKSNKLDFFANGTYEYRFETMSITENGTWSFADWKLALTSEAGREMPAELIRAEEKKEEEAPAATNAPTPEESGYAPNTLVLPFTADINAQLSTTFFVESSVWGPALGASGSYMPTESEDLLFSWSCAGKSNKLDFFANGTYEYRFETMSITENGTWSFADWKLALTSEAGREMPAELIRAEEKKEEEAPAATDAPAAEESGYPANTFVLNYVADINEQLTGTFSSLSSVWGSALGASGSYAPTESKDLLFSWDSTGKSKELDFYANGTYEFRFTKMSITERGTWSFEGWKLKLTTEAGREIAAELTK